MSRSRSTESRRTQALAAVSYDSDSASDVSKREKRPRERRSFVIRRLRFRLVFRCLDLNALAKRRITGVHPLIRLAWYAPHRANERAKLRDGSAQFQLMPPVRLHFSLDRKFGEHLGSLGELGELGGEELEQLRDPPILFSIFFTILEFLEL